MIIGKLIPAGAGLSKYREVAERLVPELTEASAAEEEESPTGAEETALPVE